ncbi:flavoprotein-like protein, partial [Pavlovales sp. CCMP2436]
MLDRLQGFLNRLTAGALPPPRCALAPSTPAAPNSGKSGWNVLLIHAHPLKDSYSAALARATEDGLRAGGHCVSRWSVYAWVPRGGVLQAALSADERVAYYGKSVEAPSGRPALPPDIAPFVDELLSCDAVVFVYPTWWFSLPAALKGLIDRTFVPGVAFFLPSPSPSAPSTGATGLVAGLTNVKRVGAVTTYGAPRHIAALAGDGGNALLGRALLPLYHPECTISWLGLYSLHASQHEERRAFLQTVFEHYRDDFLPPATRAD